MNEQQAFMYLKSMVDMCKISKELNPESMTDDAIIMADAVNLLLRTLNKLESENAILKSKMNCAVAADADYLNQQKTEAI